MLLIPAENMLEQQCFPSLNVSKTVTSSFTRGQKTLFRADYVSWCHHRAFSRQLENPGYEAKIFSKSDQENNLVCPKNQTWEKNYQPEKIFFIDRPQFFQWPTKRLTIENVRINISNLDQQNQLKIEKNLIWCITNDFSKIMSTCTKLFQTS